MLDDIWAVTHHAVRYDVPPARKPCSFTAALTEVNHEFVGDTTTCAGDCTPFAASLPSTCDGANIRPITPIPFRPWRSFNAKRYDASTMLISRDAWEELGSRRQRVCNSHELAILK